MPHVARQDRDILERAVRTLSEQAAKADALVDEALNAGLNGSHPVTLQAKLLRHELLQVKADLERELAHLVLDYSDCGRTVDWVAGLGTRPGHWRIESRRPTARRSSRASVPPEARFRPETPSSESNVRERRQRPRRSLELGHGEARLPLPHASASPPLRWRLEP